MLGREGDALTGMGGKEARPVLWKERRWFIC